MNTNESEKQKQDLIITVDILEILKLCYLECGSRLMN